MMTYPHPSQIATTTSMPSVKSISPRRSTPGRDLIRALRQRPIHAPARRALPRQHALQRRPESVHVRDRYLLAVAIRLVNHAEILHCIRRFDGIP
jgi:hypothetical protein